MSIRWLNDLEAPGILEKDEEDNFSRENLIGSMRANRMMRSSMVSSRWISTLEEPEFFEEDIDDEMSREDKISNEIARLQSELSSLREEKILQQNG
eukprot:9624438-Ditylum_brightwellii.AAC.1